ncbi:MAG TPA: tRNA preQ1(34) S-adenosylmethionine ribosyltransferase-isomerase QueA [Firmicutes bacterium]|nr:tRNA preQ1(34) S-adenosylmethionine ribosyltransferase-isomerase QueA [Bacillota bacterium]
MRTDEFDYDLPEELIAQEPAEPRDSSRLMVLKRRTGEVDHRVFCDLPVLLNPGDLLVMNDSRVIPARLFGYRRGGGKTEVLLLRDMGDGVWECLVRPGNKVRPGSTLSFSDGEVTAEVLSKTDAGGRLVRFSSRAPLEEALERIGKVPLPPYIKRDIDDPERYQTVYAKVKGSAAAPTAGLHFTRKLLDEVEAKGIGISFITLHVGIDTFRPVREEEIEQHVMHSEVYTVPPEVVEKIRSTKRAGGRVVAVGTTVVRSLESASASGELKPSSGWTSLFIYPGYKFKTVDCLITNFHLPRSTLLMLVCAFAGKELVLRAYREAVDKRYRFFSFGDAMLIL